MDAQGGPEEYLHSWDIVCDEKVPLDVEQQIVDALQECGADVQFTIYPDDGHDIEDLVYGNPDPRTWLLSQKLE